MGGGSVRINVNERHGTAVKLLHASDIYSSTERSLVHLMSLLHKLLDRGDHPYISTDFGGNRFYSSCFCPF